MLALVRSAMKESGLPPLEEVYRREAAFVWRTVRYLGVPRHQVEDVVHEVFIIVLRRRDDFDPSYSVRSWLAGITRRVVMHHKRSASRSQRKLEALPSPEDWDPGPDELISKVAAADILDRFLEGLDPKKREVFVLAELEQMSAPEISKATGVRLNTVYSRLRAARRAFTRTVTRLEKTRRREHG